MFTLKNLLPLVFGEIFWKKMIAYTLLFLIGYLLRDFLVLFFVTFLFAYIFLELGTYLSHKIHDWWVRGKKDTAHILAQKYSTANIVITVLYIVFISIVVFIFVNILPQIGWEINRFLKEAPKIATEGQNFLSRIEEGTSMELWLSSLVWDLVSSDNLESIGQKAISYITNAGIIFTKFFIALILSYLFIIDRKKIERFLAQIKNGNFRFLYEEWSVIAKKLGSGFGLIFKAQSIIALVNAILTVIGLLIISFLHGGVMFPFIVTLSLIVFICGFIPVFGTFLSWVPILILAYGYGSASGDGLIVVFSVILMIAIVHAVEAYYLNPKIVSSYMHFPVFITFVILIVSEHIFGLIGLLIGVPLFSIIIWLIEDLDHYASEIQKKIYIPTSKPLKE
jgi:predicted PurR-regulated permease PerM